MKTPITYSLGYHMSVYDRNVNEVIHCSERVIIALTLSLEEIGFHMG